MQLLLDIKLNGNAPYYIPKQYNRKVCSWIKEQLSDNILKSYYIKGKNKMKPFSFSLYIPEIELNNNVFVTNNPNLKLIISTNNDIFFYSFFRVINKKLFKRDIFIKRIIPQKDPIFNKPSAVFKTLSPIILNKIINKKGAGYLDHNSLEFKEQIKYNIINIEKNFGKTSPDLDAINVDIVAGKRIYLVNYGGEKGIQGIIKIDAPVSVLKTLYDVGIGSKRSQGYGLLEKIW